MATKKTTSVKVILTIESVPGNPVSTVYFTDGTRAVVKDKTMTETLSKPEYVAPNLVQITTQGNNIVSAEVVDTDAVGE